MKNLWIACCAGLVAASLALAAPQGTEAVSVNGTWSLNNWTARDAVHFRLSYRKAGSSWEWGNDQKLADLHGLTKEELRAVSAPAQFTMERDPGVFFFEGTIMLGVGRGEFRFVPNLSFASKLEALGYEDVDSDPAALMFMAVREVSLDFAAAVRSSGMKDMTVADLVRLRDHDIDAVFLRELAAAGYPALTADEVVRLRDHGIDARYVARIHAAGFRDVTVDQIVKLHDHGVD